VEAAGGLKVHRGADQLVNELEGIDVLDDPVTLADNPEDIAGVLADVGPPAGDLLAAWQLVNELEGIDVLDDVIIGSF
jgi:hypothetical protein